MFCLLAAGEQLPGRAFRLLPAVLAAT